MFALSHIYKGPFHVKTIPMEGLSSRVPEIGLKFTVFCSLCHLKRGMSLQLEVGDLEAQ